MKYRKRHWQEWPAYISALVRQIGENVVADDCEFDAPFGLAAAIGHALRETRMFAASELRDPGLMTRVALIVFDPGHWDWTLRHEGGTHWGDAEITSQAAYKLIKEIQAISQAVCGHCGGAAVGNCDIDGLRYCVSHQSDPRPKVSIDAEHQIVERLETLRDSLDPQKSRWKTPQSYADKDPAWDFEKSIRAEFTEKIVARFPNLFSADNLMGTAIGWWPTLVNLCETVTENTGVLEGMRVLNTSIQHCQKNLCPICGDQVDPFGDPTKTDYCIAHDGGRQLNQIEHDDLVSKIQAALGEPLKADDVTVTEYSWPEFPDLFRRGLRKLLGPSRAINNIQFDFPHAWVVPVARALKTYVDNEERRSEPRTLILQGIKYRNDGWVIDFVSKKKVDEKTARYIKTIGDADLEGALQLECGKICIVCGCETLDAFGDCSNHDPWDRSKTLKPLHPAAAVRAKKQIGTILKMLGKSEDFFVDEEEEGPRDAEPITNSEVMPTLIPIPGMIEAKEKLKGDILNVYREFECLGSQMPLVGKVEPKTLIDTIKREMPWVVDIDRLYAHLRLSKNITSGGFRLRPILLVGPPGSGKSHLAARLAQIGGTKVWRMNCAGSTDARTILGTARGYSSSTPGVAAVAMKNTGVVNPMIVLEDLDRAVTARSQYGRISDAILRLLENLTSANTIDECLGLSINASKISWIITANQTETLPEALLSRLQIIEVPMPRIEDFAAVHQALLKSVAEEYEYDDVKHLPELDDQVIGMLKKGFAKAKNLRSLRRAYVAALAIAADVLLLVH